MCLGRDESRSDLRAGLMAVAASLAARGAAHEQTWIPVGDVYSDDFPRVPSPAGLTPAEVEPVW